MLGSTLLRSPASSSGMMVGPSMGRGGRSERKRRIVVRSQRNYPPFPKPLRPMGRPTLYDEFIDHLPLVDKTKEKLTEYCTTLEGEECCSCWDAYFELKELEEKWPAEKFNSFLRDVSHDGMKSLIFSTHYTARIEKESDKVIQETTKELGERAVEVPRHVPDGLPKTVEVPRHVPDGLPKTVEVPRHVPDGLPKTQEEIEEEEQSQMPSSDFTRLLRSLRIYPSWYVQRPDVEND